MDKTKGPVVNDLTLRPIGRIFTGYRTPRECPRNIADENPPSRLEIDDRYLPALLGLEPGKFYDILYWLDRGDRSDASLVQTSRRTGGPIGVFRKRSPHRPNPIGLSRVELLAADGGCLTVGGLDCIDGTILLDIKPAVD
jgi:tRNA-Thr(GGU) m(6)t(6)A37 methyltransferase TsaA